MLDPVLLPLLRCPETGQPLSPLPPEEAARLAASGGLNRGGKPVPTDTDTFLVREDGTVAYPVRGGIPLLLVEEGVALGGFSPHGDSSQGSLGRF